VVLRGAGDIPVTVMYADEYGVARIAHGHFPLKSVEVDGVDHSESGGVWGGDEFEAG
jgi:hypothetical protein